MLCGLPGATCNACLAFQEVEELRRWPHLAKPGPQPHNQIAGTLAEQYQRALHQGRRPQKDHAQQVSIPTFNDAYLLGLLKAFEDQPKAIQTFLRLMKLEGRR
jgi:hypothetical protein